MIYASLKAYFSFVKSKISYFLKIHSLILVMVGSLSMKYLLVVKLDLFCPGNLKSKKSEAHQKHFI